MTVPAHVYQLFVRATPERVWQAITDPAETIRYFHGTALTSALHDGATFHYVGADGAVAVEGLIEAREAPTHLVMTWRFLYRAELAAEPPSKVEWTIEAAGEGLTRVRVVHRDLARSPLTWSHVKDGWAWILDSMKSLIETGEALPEWTVFGGVEVAGDVAGGWHRSLAMTANNSIWEMFDAERTPTNDEDMIRRAYAAAYHWERASGYTAVNEVRALYMIAKAHVIAGHADQAMDYAARCLALTTATPECADFDLAYAYEVNARAAALAGDAAASLDWWTLAKRVEITNPGDKVIVDGDFADAPAIAGE